ncbi:hypothetical protein FOA52_006952 [Chlamydomonas sp. UWO 241]|nr:hypothetical protein FOA52_006952 [Chlamydomonas sp. UWO 241]
MVGDASLSKTRGSTTHPPCKFFLFLREDLAYDVPVDRVTAVLEARTGVLRHARDELIFPRADSCEKFKHALQVLAVAEALYVELRVYVCECCANTPSSPRTPGTASPACCRASP